jgi:hypothetical protein
MEKLKFSTDFRTHDTPVWMAIHAMSKIMETNKNEYEKIMTKFHKDKDNTFEVELKINGVECSFVSLTTRLMEDFDRQVQ